MNAHDLVLVGSLAERCPALLPVLQEHLDDYDGLLPHVFIADVTRWLADRYATDPTDEQVACGLDVLEAAFAVGHSDDRELIAASFLENLPRGDERGHGLRDAIGPALRDHVARFG